jgi:hypothetical protein
MAEKKKPGDLTHLGRTDPVVRDTSQIRYLSERPMWRSGPDKAMDAARKSHSESVRREHRQQEDSTAYMKNAKHYKG